MLVFNVQLNHQNMFYIFLNNILKMREEQNTKLGILYNIYRTKWQK